MLHEMSPGGGECEDSIQDDPLLHLRIHWCARTIESWPENPKENGSNQREDV